MTFNSLIILLGFLKINFKWLLGNVNQKKEEMDMYY